MDSGNVVPLRPAHQSSLSRDVAGQTFQAMLDGWRNQMLARNLAFSTIDGRERLIRKLVADLNEFPWTWTSAMFDEWLGDRRAVSGHARSTIRTQGLGVRFGARATWQSNEGLASQTAQRPNSFWLVGGLP